MYSEDQLNWIAYGSGTANSSKEGYSYGISSKVSTSEQMHGINFSSQLFLQSGFVGYQPIFKGIQQIS
jgi:hypothetical protein